MSTQCARSEGERPCPPAGKCAATRGPRALVLLRPDELLVAQDADEVLHVLRERGVLCGRLIYVVLMYLT